MADIYQNLYEFIDMAERSRKYPTNTAGGFKAALRLFEKELNDDEKKSLDLFKEHLEAIYLNVYKNNKKMAAKSLEEYKRRVKALIDDYQKYAHDPAKMVSWNRPVHIRKSNGSHEKNSSETNDASGASITTGITDQTVNMDKIELTIRDGVKAIVLIPSDLTVEEARRITKIIDAHASA